MYAIISLSHNYGIFCFAHKTIYNKVKKLQTHFCSDVIFNNENLKMK